MKSEGEREGAKIQRVGCENGRRGHRRKGEGDGGNAEVTSAGLLTEISRMRREMTMERSRRKERRGGLRKQLAKMIPWSKRGREEEEEKKE